MYFASYISLAWLKTYHLVLQSRGNTDVQLDCRERFLTKREVRKTKEKNEWVRLRFELGSQKLGGSEGVPLLKGDRVFESRFGHLSFFTKTFLILSRSHWNARRSYLQGFSFYVLATIPQIFTVGSDFHREKTEKHWKFALHFLSGLLI